MLNYIWLGLVVLAVVIGGFTHNLKEVTAGAFDMAKFAVMGLALPLVGIMALWLGMMRLAESAGLVQMLARALRPVLKRLFPDVPNEHPAMGAMVMNIAANMLGLANAATPLGLRAMKCLETLNPHPGTATNAMSTFLVINTSSVQLIPMTAVGILAINNSVNPTAIVGTAFMATVCSTAVGLTAVKFFERLRAFKITAPTPKPATATEPAPAAPTESEESTAVVPGVLEPMGWTARVALFLFLGFFVWLFLRYSFPALIGAELNADFEGQKAFIRVINSVSLLAIPFLLSFFPLYAVLRRVKVYEEFVEGAKEGFHVAVRIIPYLVAILVAIGMFRGAGGIEMLTKGLSPVLNWVGFPPDLLPMAIMRPLSGSGSLGVFTEIVKQFGPDHLFTRMAGTIYGSTETTFYVLAVYFGAVGIKRTRHALPAGLIADAAGVIAAVIICRIMFG
jgi:spore maturation protein SpmA/spore maturation protein SpmB